VSKIFGSSWFRRAAPVAAVALGVVTFGIGMAEAPLDSLAHQAGTGGPLADTLTTAVAILPATAVATLLAARRPRNPIGWLLLAILIVGFNPSSQYIVLDYRMHHGTLPWAGWRWYSRSAGRCSCCSSRSCCGSSPTGGCRRAGGTAGRWFSSLPGC
jgi:hypothetical protein